MRHGYHSMQQAGEQVQEHPRLRVFQWAVLTAIILLAVSAAAQNPSGSAGNPARQRPRAGAAKKTRPPTTEDQQSQEKAKAAAAAETAKFQALVPEFVALMGKLQSIQLPPLRNQSRLLPLLPSGTVFYASTPNLGDAARQAEQIFHLQLQESPGLRDWWQQLQKDSKAPPIEDALEKFHQISEYLGNEFVFSADAQGKKDGAGLMIAEIQKPGLKEFLQKMVADLGGKWTSDVRIFTPQELQAASASVKGSSHKDEILILVRNDYLVLCSDLASLQRFNDSLDIKADKFNVTPFGQKISQAYHNGAGMLMGLDLERILEMRPKGKPSDEAIFQQTGFDNVKYLIAERKDVAGRGLSHLEVSFNGARHGIASWLAMPGPLGGLDFASPEAISAGSVLLKSPAAIFDDLKIFADASKPGSSQGLDQMQSAFNLDLKQDLLSKLGGEFSYAVDGPVGADMGWTVALKVIDPDGLQKTIEKLLAATMGVPLDRQTANGLTYYSLQVPSGQKPLNISYTNVDGYMVIGPGRDKVMEAVQRHKSGKSLAKSGKIHSLIPEAPSQVSGLTYQTMSPFQGLMMQQLALGAAAQQTAPNPTAAWLRGDESSISSGSSGQGFDASMILIVAAVGIPNLMRSRMAANEAAAAATVRTLNTAQAAYAVAYPNKGYANMAALGPGPNPDCDTNTGPTAVHACLIDSMLGCATGTWCTKDAYRYTMIVRRKALVGVDYAVAATPVDSSHGSKNFCSTSDAVVRVKTGSPLTAPISVAECQTWNPM